MTDRLLMLIEKSGHCLSFYDATTGALADSIVLPEFPHEFVVDSMQQYAYVGHYGVRTSSSPEEGGSSILVVDIVERKVVRTINCRPYYRIHGIAMDRFDRLYALSESSGVLLQFCNPLTAELPARAVVSGGLKSHLFALSRDGQWAYCMNLLSHTVTKVSPHDATFAPLALSPGEKPEGIALSADEKTLFVTNRLSQTLVSIDTATMTIKQRAPARPDPVRIYTLGDGRLLVANYEDSSVTLVDPHSLAEIRRLELSGRPAAAYIDMASNTAFVSLSSTDECVKIDLDVLRVVWSFTTKTEPDCCFLLQARPA